MNRAAMLGVFVLGAARLSAQQPREQRVDPAIAARAEALLRRMTLEEKVGQMTQLTSQAVSRTRGTATTEQQLDSAKLEDALVRHHVGSLLNVWDAALTPERWRELITTAQRFAARDRLKIPV